VPLASTPEGTGDRFSGRHATLPTSLLEVITASGAKVVTEEGPRTDAARDWWPISIGWAVHGQVPARPAAVVEVGSAAQVAATLAACTQASVPVTPFAGRSGVCGGSVPIFGGLALDCTGLGGPIDVDEDSLVADVPAGIFGPDLEAALGAIGDGYTLGHWPQSMDLSTVGGWLACRGAGQYSTRYGKIEDMVIGLEVVTADGRIVETEGRGPRAATGPSLTQLFVGSEGTLGVITRARLRVHPRPSAEGRRAYGFSELAEGLDACRRVLRRGATPAVLRLYDRTESERSFGRGGTCVLIVLDEADPKLLDATLGIVDDECRTARALDEGLVEQWLAHRNDVSALGPLWQAGIVVDTIEVAARWAALPTMATEVLQALEAVPGTLMASVHESHAYPDGACLYFTFAGRDPSSEPEERPQALQGSGETAWEERYYVQAWDAAISAVERCGGAISHHHGIGLNRGRFLSGALGSGFEVLVALKRALDPQGILNPGKLGLPSDFGPPPWP
jgi:alkyldihydroxyacetonephosphate synthase